MVFWTDLLIVFIILLNILMLASSRVSTCISIVAAQGVLTGLMPIAADFSGADKGTIIFSAVTIILKGIIFPILLFRTERVAEIRKEVEPIGGYPLSVVLGVALFLISFWLSARLPYERPIFSSMIVPVSFATFFTGALIIVSRMKAITQVLGYLILENGIYLFGSALLTEKSFLVELAILLDIFAALFVMGIAIFHISREFDHIDTRNLSQLKDWVSDEE